MCIPPVRQMFGFHARRKIFAPSVTRFLPDLQY